MSTRKKNFSCTSCNGSPVVLRRLDYRQKLKLHSWHKRIYGIVWSRKRGSRAFDDFMWPPCTQMWRVSESVFGSRVTSIIQLLTMSSSWLVGWLVAVLCQLPTPCLSLLCNSPVECDGVRRKKRDGPDDWHVFLVNLSSLPWAVCNSKTLQLCKIWHAVFLPTT